MILGMTAFTIVHVVIKLAGILSGLVVLLAGDLTLRALRKNTDRLSMIA
jgi:hypothetical protein